MARLPVRSGAKSKKHTVSHAADRLQEHAYTTSECPYIRQGKWPRSLLSLQMGWICSSACKIKGNFKRQQLHGLLSYVTKLFEVLVVMEKC